MSMKASGLPTVALLALLTWGCDDEPGGGDGGGVDGAVDAAADVGAGGAGGSPADGGGDRGLIDAMLDGAVADARTPDGMVMDGALTDARITDARFADGAVADAEPPEAAVDPPDAAPDARVVPLDARVDPADAAPDAQLDPADAAPDAQVEPPDAAVARNPLPQQPNRTCRLPAAPPLGAFATERAYPRLAFNRPIWFGTAPGDPDTIFVAEQGGTIYAFDDRPDVAARDTFLRLDVLRAGNEEGLLGLAFHPDYADNGRLYVYYSAARENCPGNAPRCSILAEFTREAPRAADPMSERRLLEVRQPFSNHNGGDLRFGPDGHLYVSLGDGGSGGDPEGNGQNTRTLLGAILRIDVDREGDPVCPDCRYGIPPDNPFADGLDGAPEIWAWGLRNPWRMAFDPITGALWTGDVGQNRWEEIDRIEGPGNFGWNTLEGFECYGGGACDDAGMIPPVWVYGRMQGQSITGGLVYRGPRLPELWGRYLFADYVSGRVWSLRERDGDEPEVTLLAQQASVTHFGADAAGRVYLTTFDAQRPIARLVRAAPPAGEPFPARLSETGCFADTAGHVLAPGVVPYQVNRPFWSDHAEKLRAIAVPEGATVGYRPDDPFVLPVGTVLVKTFLMPQADGSRRRISTRLFTRQADGWRGFVYRWNEAQTDAELLDGARYEVIDTVNGPQTWNYPGQIECALCHLDAAGGALGWSTRQLSGTFELDGVRYDQLDALAAIGLLDGLPPAGPRPAHPRPGEAASLDAEARATLDVNCAPCHRPGGVNARLDLRAQSPLDVTELCERAEKGDLGLEDPHIVAAGDPAASILVRRMTRRDTAGMPPIGSVVVDAESVDLVSRWIESLESCP
ncbi:MAG: PQQ-dependent sugar dehydrogenase [Myxococcales bacterium]|nr:PQQ-dependent sugar dehydrogenase [Myxococcales bacterium]